MAIKIGANIPDVTLKRLAHNTIEEVSTGALFSDRKIALFGVPGAFTPTCSDQHLPGFLKQADNLKTKKNIDDIICMAVNDPFVMKAWGNAQGVSNTIYMLPDGNATFTQALGLSLDASGFGMGDRCQRFSLVADHGKVMCLFIENPGEFHFSNAEHMLKTL